MATSSLERIYPDSDNEIGGNLTLQLHVERYHFAGKNLIPGLVADVACGSGYGAHLLATEYGNNLRKIIAIDNNDTAISYAAKNYKAPLIEFIKSDALSFRSKNLFSTIISLETIEHLSKPEKFVLHFALQLSKGGRFIASAPVTPSMDANPYHLQDFTISSFKNLFTQAGLTEVNSFLQKQHYNPFKLFRKKQERTKEIRQGLINYYFKHPGKLALRLKSFFRDGFTNKYLIVVFEKR